jgi:hypothetical protein
VEIGSFEIPSESPVFLSILAIHVLFGVLAVVTGAVAMFVEKRRGGHTRDGSIYFWSLATLFATSTALAAMRWADDYHLFALGTLAFAAALLGQRREGKDEERKSIRTSLAWAFRTSRCSRPSMLITAGTYQFGDSCPIGCIGWPLVHLKFL